jgi:hypothetical protein
MRRSLPILILAPVFLAGSPSQVSGPELATILKVLSASAGAPGRVACRDMDLSLELKRSGLSPDAKSPLAWAASPDQLKDYLAEGKLVVVGSETLLREGAGIAIVREKGKPVIVVATKNVASTGVKLSDAVMRIARLR